MVKAAGNTVQLCAGKKGTWIWWMARNLCQLLSHTGDAEVFLSLITGGNEYFHDAENLMNMQMTLGEG